MAYIESESLLEHLPNRVSQVSFRYPSAFAVMNTETPGRCGLALRYLQRDDLARLLRSPNTSVYLRRCIERLSGGELSATR